MRRNRIVACLLGEEDLLAGPLEIGLNAPLRVREERLSSSPNVCRLMYVSDIHLRGGRSGHLAMQVVDAVRRCDANAVLLGGDLVDNSSELGSLRAMVEQLAGFGPVLAVGGNHDGRVGTSRVRDAVINGGGAWIHDGSVNVRHGSRVISVFGPDFAAQPTGDVRVLCAQPADLENVATRRL